MDPVIDFFVVNFPPWPWIAVGGPVALLWSFASLSLAGWCKSARGWRTGYTRKLFHLSTFTVAALLHGTLGTPAVCLFGGATSIVILAALLRGDGDPRYEALAREKDAPHRTHYIVVPYLATLFGGMTVSIWLPQTAAVGFLVAGLGDAVGEPIGVRFGKHHYRVPSLRSVVSTRSLEGSAAVIAASALAIAAALLFSDLPLRPWHTIVGCVLLACVCGLVEAVSPHGWDNFTMQVVPAWLASWYWVAS